MKRKKFEVKYEVDDGYCGGSRPQYTSISAEDFGPEADEQKLRDLFWEEIQSHFEQNIQPDFGSGGRVRRVGTETAGETARLGGDGMTPIGTPMMIVGCVALLLALISGVMCAASREWSGVLEWGLFIAYLLVSIARRGYQA